MMFRMVVHWGPEIDFGGSGDPSIGGLESSIGGLITCIGYLDP